MGGQSTQNNNIALEILEHSPSLAMRVSAENKKWAALFITKNISAFGYAKEEFLNHEITWADIVHPKDYPMLCAAVDAYDAQRIDLYTVNYRVFTKDGQIVWVADSTTVTRDEYGKALYLDRIISDHTGVKKSQEKIEENMRQQTILHEVLQRLNDSDIDKVFDFILARTGSSLGVSRVLLYEDDTEHKTAKAVFEWCNKGINPVLEHGIVLNYEEDIPITAAELKNHGKQIVHEAKMTHNMESPFKKQGVLSSVRFAVNLPEGRFGFISFDECSRPRRWEDSSIQFLANITKLVSSALMRKNNAASIEYIAAFDQLTGLSNRYRFESFIIGAIAHATSTKQHGYVLFIDMDDFKVINDGYGHDFGDALLVSIANFFKEQFEDEALLFRFGGDEFVILLETTQPEQAQHVIDKIIARAQSPWEVRGQQFYCTLSIGVVRYPESGKDLNEIIKNGDIALYQAKKIGKNSYVTYSPLLDNDAMARAETEHRMRQAIDNDFEGFIVHYQPMVNLKGEICSAEALLRWVDADGKMSSPGEFIPLAEYLGLIIPLGDYVLRQAARECRLINQTHPDFTISVNVSMRQFQQPDFVEKVKSAIMDTGVKPENMILEVTEGLAVQDLQQIKRVMGQLRSMGILVAIDDFGTGYSSLSNMREIPLDIVKIDRSFIRDISVDAYSKSFVRLIIDLSHSMGRKVCVEGVETKEQLDYCVKFGADSIQGFYFWKPMAADPFRIVVNNADSVAKL